MAIAKVEPLTTARALRGPFDYSLPERLGDVEVGSVLMVPFGRQQLPGVVVELAERSELPPERLAEPLEAVTAGASAELVRLGLWVAREYCSTPARGLGLVLPPGAGRRGRPAATLRELRALPTEDGRKAVAVEGRRLGERQRAVLAALADRDGEMSAAELDEAVGASRDTLRRLARRGLVRLREVELRRTPAVATVGAPPRAVELTGEQASARDAVIAAIEGTGPRELLLHGVTGSGKTEVYLAAAEAALAGGRGTIVLVPEIALTPQTMGRFRARFGSEVALLHSRLAPGERADEWRRLRSGEARLCVGPRSAVFAPIEDLGLVVIDEEHDPSYKQEGDPRYDARDVARRRAADAGAAVVAGTATPRPESWHELSRIELTRRVDGRRLPEVEVLDMRGRDLPSGPLHGRTREELERVRRGDGKAILLLNRRGWAPHLACRECGHGFPCPSCDVSLVVHRGSGMLRCHHCGHAEASPERCPECGSVTLARLGAGTERIEAFLAELLDPLPVFRLDSDSVAPAGGHLGVLRAFQEAPGGVLIGTQMVAKGHDFTDVTLSVVLDADATLRFPDFRSEERTFALVSQLAGRSGRGEAGGRVLVQTLAPDARAIQAAARHDAAGFLAGELGRRRELRYPPFSHLIGLELAAPEAADAERAANLLAVRLRGGLPAGGELLGPAPRFRVRGRHRRQLLVKAPERAPAVDAVRAAVESAATAREIRPASLAVDVDPQ
jgi:primosomal protein N' (replication factor Y) (superfamily II helicase)